LEREESKLKIELKKEAKKGLAGPVRTLAVSLVRSRKQRERLLEYQTRINSAVLAIKTNVATQKVVGAMQKSSQVMHAMSAVISIPQVSAVAKNLSKDMLKAGIIEEMVNEGMEAVDSEDINSEADKEVEAVIAEITAGELSGVGAITNSLEQHRKKNVQKEVAKEEEDEKDLDDIKDRLQKLGSQ